MNTLFDDNHTCKVVNVRYADYDIYVGRYNNKIPSSKIFYDNILGNPYVINFQNTRKIVIELYKLHFYKLIKDDPLLIEKLKTLKGKTLGCWCAPKACHADIIASYVNTHI